MFWAITLGIATGMRTFTALAVVCWVAYLGYLPVEGTWAFWTAKLASVIIFSALALGEYFGDTRAGAPSRTTLMPLVARLISGNLVGVIVATGLGQPKISGILLGTIGALIGTYGGYRARMFGARIVGRDFPVALAESAVALGISMYAMQEIVVEVVRNGVPAVLRAPR
jgi:uncharacterized membrane protein